MSYPEISTGAVARYLGLLAASCGRDEDAALHFAQALKVNERVGARSWLAHSQADYARLARARVDGALAEELLEAAIATYRELGMDSHESNAVALARASR